MRTKPMTSSILTMCLHLILNYLTGLVISRGRGFDSQPEGLGVAFFATGPGLGLIMYILTTLGFPKHTTDLYLHYPITTNSNPL